MEDKDNDGVPDFMQRGQSRAGDSLNDALKRNLMSIRGRRNVIRNIPIEILPTKFEDDEDPPSIDEEGEEVGEDGIIKKNVKAIPEVDSYETTYFEHDLVYFCRNYDIKLKY